MSVTLTTLHLPVDVIIHVCIPITSISVTWLGGDIGTVCLAVILVGIRDDTAYGAVDTVSVGDWAIIGVVVGGVAVVTMVEDRASMRGMGGVWDLTVGTGVSGSGGGGGHSGGFADVGALTP